MLSRLFLKPFSEICTTGYPQWPKDFKFSHAGPINSMACININEVASPSNYTWADNYFCHASLPRIQGVGMVWSNKGNKNSFLIAF